MPRPMPNEPEWLTRGLADGSIVAHRVGELPKGRAQVMPGRRAFVEVPVPPSTNNLYANAGKKGRIKSAAYKAWQEQASFCLMGLSVPPGPWSIRYTVCAGKGWPENRDLGNAEKPLTDLLVAAGLIEDDCTRYVRRVSVDYDPTEGGPKTIALVRIQISQWSAGT